MGEECRKSHHRYKICYDSHPYDAATAGKTSIAIVSEGNSMRSEAVGTHREPMKVIDEYEQT